MSTVFADSKPILQDHPPSVLSGAVGSLRGLFIARYLEGAQGQALVICPDDDRVRELASQLRFFGHSGAIRTIPGIEILPYDTESPNASLISARGQAFRYLRDTQGEAEQTVLVLSVPTLMRRMASTAHWFDAFASLRIGDVLCPDELRQRLGSLGYYECRLIEDPGQYCFRPSGIMDIFPMGGDGAIRVVSECTAGRITALRRLDVNTQRSSESGLSSVLCMPRYEVPCDTPAIERFRQHWRKRFSDHMSSGYYASVSAGTIPEGVESFLPFFCETATVLDLLAPDTPIFFTDGADEAADRYWKAIMERYADLRSYGESHLLEPEELWLSPQAIGEALRGRQVTRLQAHADGSGEAGGVGGAPHRISPAETLEEAIGNLTPWMRSARRILFVMRSSTRISHMLLICKMLRRPAQQVSSWDEFVDGELSTAVTVSDFDEGFDWPGHGITVITERDLFGQPIYQKSEEDEDSASGAIWQDGLLNLSSVREGDPIVHIDQGVGRFDSMEPMSLGGSERDFLKIEYREGVKVFVQMDDLDRVLPYGGGPDEKAPLDEANSAKWRKGLRESQEDILHVAQALHAARQAREQAEGIAFSPPDHLYERFASKFPFQETRDQRRAIDDIIADMTRECPMDRVICGDVGFGKTEVAMRAAFLAARDGYQVALLAPTTLLAQQHEQTFRRRFAEFGHRVTLLARGEGEGRSNLDAIASGEARVVIGTHRMLQADVRFANLGLVIIDEEHRFGVRQKQRMAEFRGHTDLLSLTATPIPRTLSLSLQGVRDMSILSTPPARRLPIKTAFRPRAPELIKEAIDREMMRGGQVFFIHNAIESIEAVAGEVRKLVPQARVRIGHGRMSVDELEAVMGAFYRHEFDVLVCTTIIETGIDIPNANTILIDRCERFGIAQLHQLRGRVGRARRQAYAYLMADDIGSIPDQAQRRLNAVVSSARLGQGLALASHDLEIRGTGELLGESQSGRIRAVGFYLYMHLLTQTLDALRSGREVNAERNLSRETDIQIAVGGLIPPDYVDDIGLRLAYYKRIASAQALSDCQRIEDEMADRFGPLPFATERLIERTRIRAMAHALDVRSIHLRNQEVSIRFWSYGSVDLRALMRRIERQSETMRFSEDGDAVVCHGHWGGEHERMERIKQVLESFQ